MGARIDALERRHQEQIGRTGPSEVCHWYQLDMSVTYDLISLRRWIIGADSVHYMFLGECYIRPARLHADKEK